MHKGNDFLFLVVTFVLYSALRSKTLLKFYFKYRRAPRETLRASHTTDVFLCFQTLANFLACRYRMEDTRGIRIKEITLLPSPSVRRRSYRTCINRETWNFSYWNSGALQFVLFIPVQILYSKIRRASPPRLIVYERNWILLSLTRWMRLDIFPRENFGAPLRFY